jgi:hypothetical protein
MACSTLDALFELATHRGREFPLAVSFTYLNYYEPPGRRGNTSSGSGSGRLPYFPAQVVSYIIDELPVLDQIPPRFFSQVSYATTGGASTYDTTLQISAPLRETLRAASSYLVIIGNNPGPLKGSFVPACDSLVTQESPLEVIGTISGFAEAGLHVTITLRWSP